MNKLELLREDIRPLFTKFIDELSSHNLEYSILETLRTIETQTAYYAMGRQTLEEVNRLRKIAGLYLIPQSENKIITWTMKSNHLIGCAADIVPIVDNRIPWDYKKYSELWNKFGQIGMSIGLTWGGNWNPPDYPHYERV